MGTIRPFRLDDASAVAELLNRTWGRHELYAAISADELIRGIERTPGHSLAGLRVLEARGRIVACAGVWDWSAVERITVLGLKPGLRLLGSGLDLVRRVLPAPRVPHVGEVLQQWLLAPLGLEDPAELGALVRAINGRALAEGVGQMFMMSERGAPVLDALQGFFTVTMGMRLVFKSLLPGVKIGDRPLYVPATDA
jgi:N-acetylglutamate synthase-like GNAT family acetyltransferase